MVEKKPINVAFWAGSATTFRGVNPSFQLLTVDTKTMLPVELETHYLNLTRANAEDNPIWELHHKYTEEFNMTDLSPNSIMKYA